MNVKITTIDPEHEHLSLSIEITDITTLDDINSTGIAVKEYLSDFEKKLAARNEYFKECSRVKELERKFPVA